MSQIELRKEERRPFVRRPNGLLLLKTFSATYPINEIRDISNSGISVHLEESIAAPSEVTIEYVAGEIKVQVKGMVAWCMPRPAPADQSADAGGFTLGIELLSPMLLLAICEER
jgi:hypothetical protein